MASLNTQRLAKFADELMDKMVAEKLSENDSMYARTVRMAYADVLVAKLDSEQMDEDKSRDRC